MVASIVSQRNINMLQQPRYGLYDPAINREIISTLYQDSFAASPLISQPTQVPLGKSKLYSEQEHYKKVKPESSHYGQVRRSSYWSGSRAKISHILGFQYTSTIVAC